MQTVVFMQNSGDDELDLRQFVGKDTEIPRSERFKSKYVLFVPGYFYAPPELRSTGRLSVEVTNDQAAELMTHPVWSFVTQDVADEVKRRAQARFVAELPEVAELRGFRPDQIGPAIEVAPTAPASVATIRAETAAPKPDK